MKTTAFSMHKKTRINQKWLKASIIGTIWASSEIVLGSFLHNLRVPFSGSILTAIGLIIMIPAGYVWKDKGIFWRAGLICALMKTMSPSAVIFGPIIAILIESLLLEISVRILGRNFFGYVLGAILAVSWSFAQKIINLLIFYGHNLLKLYENIMRYAEKQLHLQFNTVWLPIVLLLSVYVVIGLAAGVIGIRTGRSLIAQPKAYKPDQKTPVDRFTRAGAGKAHQYSIFWLVINVLLIAGSILLISITDWRIWMLPTALVIIIWIAKYKRALRQLSNPKFWVFFVLITLLSALVFTGMPSNSIADAILIGVEMNFRATVLIIGFSALGTELYNPRIRDYLNKTYFKQLPLALELSVNSLPLVIAITPDLKTLTRNPVSVIAQLMSYAEFRLSELQQMEPLLQKIIILSDQTDTGKTALIKELIEHLKLSNVKTGGIYAQKIMMNDARIGYDVVSVKTNQREVFLRTCENDQLEKIGPFCIFPGGLELGNHYLAPESNTDHEIMIVDEVGKLELSGKGWAEKIGVLLKSQKNTVLMVVRVNLVDQVIDRWNIRDPVIVNKMEIGPLLAKDRILKELLNP
jgi:nucleoside-triphosphatase THEP1